MEEEFFPSGLKELQSCTSCTDVTNWRLNFSYQLSSFTVENDDSSQNKDKSLSEDEIRSYPERIFQAAKQIQDFERQIIVKIRQDVQLLSEKMKVQQQAMADLGDMQELLA